MVCCYSTPTLTEDIDEDFGMSQFWYAVRSETCQPTMNNDHDACACVCMCGAIAYRYTDETSRTLAQEAIQLGGVATSCILRTIRLYIVLLPAIWLVSIWMMTIK